LIFARENRGERGERRGEVELERVWMIMDWAVFNAEARSFPGTLCC